MLLFLTVLKLGSVVSHTYIQSRIYEILKRLKAKHRLALLVKGRNGLSSAEEHPASLLVLQQGYEVIFAHEE